MRFVSNIKALKIKKKVLRPTVSEQGTISFLVNFPQEKESDSRDGTKKSAHRLAMADQRLLESFRMRKNAECKESWRRSEISNFPDGDGDNLREVFALTRRLLINNVGPLNDRLVQDDALLEKALGKVHKFLPLPVRLILWKKRYIQFILTNRDLLTP
jgi:hypothetical protein